MTELKTKSNEEIGVLRKSCELPRLKAAHEIGNWKTVADIAHKLKGGFFIH